MSFVPAENFSTRSKPLYDAETQRIDVIMYKITEGTHADGLIRAVRRGIPVRLITEPERYRNPENVWHAYQVDRLYMAGVQIRHRAHAGFTHQKNTLLYSQGLAIFGSSNWTSESNKSQSEHNYFTTKPWFFNWVRANFERKWGNTTGNAETTAVRAAAARTRRSTSRRRRRDQRLDARRRPSAGDRARGRTPPTCGSARRRRRRCSPPTSRCRPNSTKTYTLPALSRQARRITGRS